VRLHGITSRSRLVLWNYLPIFQAPKSVSSDRIDTYRRKSREIGVFPFGNATDAASLCFLHHEVLCDLHCKHRLRLSLPFFPFPFPFLFLSLESMFIVPLKRKRHEQEMPVELFSAWARDRAFALALALALALCSMSARPSSQVRARLSVPTS
jgi:hypothetical protein